MPTNAIPKPTATTPGAQALLAARQVAAKELGLPLDSWMVRQFAVLMVAHEDVEVQLATGSGDIDHFLRARGRSHDRASGEYAVNEGSNAAENDEHVIKQRTEGGK